MRRPNRRAGAVTIVVPDAHADPEFSNARFTWLGRFLADHVPRLKGEFERVHIRGLGDFADVRSLCSYIDGKREIEGKRYAEDVACHRDAVHRMVDSAGLAWDLLDTRCFHAGNHEWRAEYYAENNPRMAGSVGIQDFRDPFEEAGAEYIDYPQTGSSEGVTYGHCMVKGGRPVTSVHQAAAWLTKGHTSFVGGHHHVLDFREDVRADGRKICALSAGMYVDYELKYAGNDVNKWRAVVPILYHADDQGDFAPDCSWTLQRIKRTYGEG